MLLTIVIVTAIVLVLFLILRCRKTMAALIAWIISFVVSKKTVEKKPPGLSAQNLKSRKKLNEATSRSTKETSTQNLKIKENYDLSKTPDLKTKKHKSNKKSSFLNETDGKNQDSNVGVLFEKAQFVANSENSLTYSDKAIQSQQEKIKNRNLSKTTDKLQIVAGIKEANIDESYKFLGTDLHILKIQKSKSLPNFQKSTDISDVAKISKSKKTSESLKTKEARKSNKELLKLDETLRENIKLDENHDQLLKGESSDKELFITVSHKRQSHKKITTENTAQSESFKQRLEERKLLATKVGKSPTTNSKTIATVESNKQSNNKEVQYIQNTNSQTAHKNLSKLTKAEHDLVNIITPHITYKSVFNKNLTPLTNKNQQTSFITITNTETNEVINNKTQQLRQQTYNRTLSEDFDNKKRIFFSKEAISSSAQEKQYKLRKIQSETEITLKKQTNLPTSNRQEKTFSSDSFNFNKTAFEIKQVEQTPKELLVKAEPKTETRVECCIPKHIEQTAVSVEKKIEEKNLTVFEVEQQVFQNNEQIDLKSSSAVVAEVNVDNLFINSTAITEERTEESITEEHILKLHQSKEESVLTVPVSQTINILDKALPDSLNTDESKPVKSTTSQPESIAEIVEQVKPIKETTTENIDTFPLPKITEHFKLNQKVSIPTQPSEAQSFTTHTQFEVKKLLTSRSLSFDSKLAVDELSAHTQFEVIKPLAKRRISLELPLQISEESLPEEEYSSIMKMATQVRVLTLNNNEHQEKTLYRIEKNWILQFRLGPSLLGRKVALYCNYPEQKNVNFTEFDRNKYYLLPWSQDKGCCNSDDTTLFAQIAVKVAGSFHYYFVYENATESCPQGSGFFLVDPVLQYGNNEELPLNCIQCQTVLSKCLGSFSTWENKLQVTKESGYNMIHFTPIQELGKSNSAYSLSGQLKLNPIFNEGSTRISFYDIEKLMSKIRAEWKVLSICDIVLNHTANETDWLQEHPESTYNCFNCPYMRPAYLLDVALTNFSQDIKDGFYESMGIPAEVTSEDHLNSIRYSLQTKVLKEINIPEMFMCDVNKLVSQFQNLARKNPPTKSTNSNESLRLIQDPAYRRLATSIDMNLAVKLYNVYRHDSFDEEARIKRCSEELKNELDKLNNNIINEINNHLNVAIENVVAGIRYFRVQHDGPKISEISVKNPLCPQYFTDYGNPKSIQEYDELMYSENSKYLMAHNGWVINADPMRNFADSDSQVYLRRELIAWGDSVKLRFGDKPEDSPFLWNHMKQYVEQTAKIFNGVRLDNCHSTPIPVAEYLLDCARKVRPDLYVVAELFTNSDHTDNVFVNRLGITSLIREAMSAWDSHEEGRLVYRYGGDPVGAFFQPHSRPLVPSIAHALFLDLSHDNPSPIEKRSVFDLLPSSALVNMACCASGSNRGYDELVNHHIHVVDEDREYTEWTNDINLALESPHYVGLNSGIIHAKKCINDLHFKLGIEGFSQVYVDQIDPDIVAVTRHQPHTHETVVLVAFTAFSHPSLNAANYQRRIKALRVEGVLDEIILEATLSHVNIGKDGSKFAYSEGFVQDQKWINGLSEYYISVKEHIQLSNSDIFELENSGSSNITQLNFKNFKPGSVVAIKVSLQKHVQESVCKLRETLSTLSKKNNTNLSNIIKKLDLADLNRALYRCDQEEKDEGYGFSTYNIPNFESLVYCGFQGFISLLANIRPSNDLGHPMCANLRDGNWMIDYISQRLKLNDGTKQLGQWIEQNIEPLKSIPRYLVPSYFEVAVTSLYVLLLEQSYHLMSDFIKNGSAFVKGLSLGSLQFAAVIKSAYLPLLSPNLASPRPLTRLDNHGNLFQECVSLSAGLPHFSVGYMRNWGRDTFIALRGLFILTGRINEARYHILGYAACLRHGLIPNLLDAGRNARFNCRDAVWWWLYCIKAYVEEVPNGVNILADKVSRIFPTDDSSPQEPGVADQPLYEVIQESLKTHFQGLAFRERNAGKQIDAHMTDKGFNNQIGINPETGFVFGGNEFNCGTWMDKMGSSDKAGNRGKPATPRDGSAIELVGLSKSVISWLGHLHKDNQYPYEGVERVNKNGSVTKWTFIEWAEKIQKNFEKNFWIDTSPSTGEVKSDLVNKCGIYKDSYGATQEWADFQLRCNFPIAMVAAPELFNPKHAWISLQNAEKYLLGALGMKTLDPEDWAYCGDYINSDDSDNFKTANGFNYHQGPEWVWPVGYYLRAKLQFAAENEELARTIANVKVILSKHFTELQTSPWRGLPELTNSNGSFCNDSSRTQAWSMACILEVLHDLQQIESRQHRLKSN